MLTVRILGMDANGRPILQTAWTVNISRNGLVIAGVRSSVNLGEVVSLQYKDRKVRYRVVWTGETGSGQAGQLGLEQLNPQDDLWQLDLPPETDSDPQERGADRRQQRRFEASLPVEVKSTQGAPIRAEMSDISLSGCYVNTLFPAAIDSFVHIVFWVGDQKLSVKGRVRTCVLGVGCGIEFIDVSAEAKKLLAQYFASGCRPASDRREGGTGTTTEAEITVTQAPSRTNR
ncbi:MAG: PilZ domain-containing protein [Terriglobales bacterium]